MSPRLLLAALILACAFTGCTNRYEDSPVFDGFEPTPAPALEHSAH